MEWFFALALGYLLGSVPFGLILTRAFGAGNLREIGSGNIGATNVLRTGSKGLAAATLLLDSAKGASAVVLATSWLDNGFAAMAGLAALVGHCFPIWLKFRGGKGIATLLGVSFALDWRIGLAALLTWLIAAWVTRISSVAGLTSALASPIVALVIARTTEPNLFFLEVIFIRYLNVYALGLMTLIVFWQHRSNIARLRAGTEARIGSKPE